MSWAYSKAASHFRLHGEKDYIIVRGSPNSGGSTAKAARTLCGTYVPYAKTRALRVGAVVECLPCLVAKDKWLEATTHKPLTFRRWRAFVTEHFGGQRPIGAGDERPTLTEAEVESSKALKRHQALEALVQRRQESVERLATKMERLAGNLARARQRLQRAERRLNLFNSKEKKP